MHHNELHVAAGAGFK